jgi:micrococcal nuclease
MFGVERHNKIRLKMYVYRCKINKVVDGDTVEIDLDLGFNIVLAKQKVRMAGIDTPESRTSNEEEKKRGMISKKKLAEKLPIGSWQKIQTMKADSNDDKFGRILGVFLMEDGMSLNNWLIDNNYAVLYQGENKELVQEMHRYNKQKLIERGELK